MGHNITRLKIPAGSLEANQLAIVQTRLRMWTRDYREQIQLAVKAGLELGVSVLQVQGSNRSATLPPRY